MTDTPASAVRLHKMAVEHEWWAEIVTTAGHALGKPDKPTCCTTVRLRKPGQPRLVAIWLDGKFRSALRHDSFTSMGSRALIDMVKGEL